MEVKGKVSSVSGPREFNQVMQVGFTLETDKSFWYNVKDAEEILEGYKEKILNKGAEIKFDYDEKTKAITNLVLVKAADKNWADDMTNFEDLLTAAHDKFEDLDIETEMHQVDFEKKTAVFQATVTADGHKFEGHGDAEGIGNEIIKPHFMRMAETRAIARALRWATNNAAVAEEETGGEEAKETH